MNYTRTQIELLRKSLATLASARAEGGDASAEPPRTAAAGTPIQALPSAKANSLPERAVLEQSAATFFGTLNWSAKASVNGSAPVARNETPEPSPPVRSTAPTTKAAEHFSRLPWTGGATDALPKEEAAHATTPVAATHATTNPDQIKASLPGNASAFFSQLSWSQPSSQQQDRGAAAERASKNDLSPADFARLATTTALASATRKAAS